MYLGGGVLTSSSKVNTGSCLETVGRRIKGFQVLCKLSMWPNLVKAGIWGWLGSYRGKLVWSSTSGSRWHTGGRWTCVCRWDHQQQDGKCLFPMSYRYWAGFWACITCQHCSTMWKSPVAPLSHVLTHRTTCLLLPIKLLWSVGCIMDRKRFPYPVLLSQISHSLKRVETAIMDIITVNWEHHLP